MKKLNAVFIGVVASLASLPAMAAIPPADLNTAVTSITADANQVFTAVFPVVALVLGLIVGIKLFKRFVKAV